MERVRLRDERGPGGFDSPVDQLERYELLDLLTSTRWNVSAAARRLGVSRVTVHARMRRLGIRRAPEEPKREALLELLTYHEWCIARVARLPGVSRQTVYNRMRRNGIALGRPPKWHVTRQAE